MEGWIKIHRKLAVWEWANDPHMVSLLVHLLIAANFKETKWRGITLKPGQLIFGREAWARKTGLSVQTIRTCMERLKSASIITSKTASKFTVVTIEKWEEYQKDDSETASKSTSKSTSNQPATNQQLTTAEECKEGKECKEYTSSFSDKSKKEAQPIAKHSQHDVPPIGSLNIKRFIFDNGIALLGDQGIRQRHARSYLGRMLKIYGEKLMLRAVKSALENEPVDAKAFIIGFLENEVEEKGNTNRGKIFSLKEQVVEEGLSKEELQKRRYLTLTTRRRSGMYVNDEEEKFISAYEEQEREKLARITANREGKTP